MKQSSKSPTPLTKRIEEMVKELKEEELLTPRGFKLIEDSFRTSLNQIAKEAMKEEANRWIDQPANQHDERIRQETDKECKEKLAHLEKFYKKFAEQRYENGRQEERE